MTGYIVRKTGPSANKARRESEAFFKKRSLYQAAVKLSNTAGICATVVLVDILFILGFFPSRIGDALYIQGPNAFNSTLLYIEMSIAGGLLIFASIVANYAERKANKLESRIGRLEKKERKKAFLLR